MVLMGRNDDRQVGFSRVGDRIAGVWREHILGAFGREGTAREWCAGSAAI